MFRYRIDGANDVCTVVLGKREVPRGTLRSILKQAGVSLRTFNGALRK